MFPKSTAGRAATFFQSILAIERTRKGRTRPRAVIVDVQNTLFNNALLRWASEDLKRKYLPRLAKDTVASYALAPKPDRGPTLSR